jgi:hypothetical protein
MQYARKRVNSDMKTFAGNHSNLLITEYSEYIIMIFWGIKLLRRCI